eukprot:scaffold32775_cov69-Phaeocystis_antarctica.AAC.2
MLCLLARSAELQPLHERLHALLLLRRQLRHGRLHHRTEAAGLRRAEPAERRAQEVERHLCRVEVRLGGRGEAELRVGGHVARPLCRGAAEVEALLLLCVEVHRRADGHALLGEQQQQQHGEQRAEGLRLGHHLGALAQQPGRRDADGLALHARRGRGRVLRPRAAQHHAAQSGLERLELRAEGRRSEARDEGGPARDHLQPHLLVALQPAQADAEDVGGEALQLGQLEGGEERAEQLARVAVGGARGQQLLEDAEDEVELLQDLRLALDHVGADEAHERRDVAGALPHGGGEQRREERLVRGRERRAALEQLREHLEDVRRELGDVRLQDLLEGREEHALEGVDGRGRRGADVAHERGDGLEEVVVERGVGRVGADAAEDRLELLDAHVRVRGHALRRHDGHAHHGAHHVGVLLGGVRLEDAEQRGQQRLQQR